MTRAMHDGTVLVYGRARGRVPARVDRPSADTMSDTTGLAAVYFVTVEDDNGIYFIVQVIALNPDDAERRVRYILNPDAARVAGIAA